MLTQQIRRHMNGEVANSMRNMDSSYKKNYGVAIGHIRLICNNIDVANVLSEADCDEMWNSGWREMMLVAAETIGRLGAIDLERIMSWSRVVANVELVNTLSRVVGVSACAKAEICDALVARNVGFDFSLALNIAGWSGEADLMRKLLMSACGMVWTSDVGRAVSFLARKAVRLGGLEDVVERVLTSAAEQDSRTSLLVVEDVRTELEYGSL